MIWLALAIAAFAIGSIPTGVLIARSKGVDLRTHGSGNIGATNVLRVLGPGPGALCFVLDFLKGLAPTLAAGYMTGLLGVRVPAPREAVPWLMVMAASVLGHMFSPWVGFKGGKGVATGLGAMLGVYPFLTIPALASLAVWAFVVAIWRYVGVASVAAAGSLPLFVLIWGAVSAAVIDRVPAAELPAYRAAWTPFLIATSLLAAVVIVKHRANIRRTLAGTESRLGQRAGPRSQNRGS
jgi:glycerol-3-phosphate acyltransferase PlsY